MKEQPSLLIEEAPEYEDCEVELSAIRLDAGLPPSQSFIDSIDRFGVMHPVLLKENKAGTGYNVIDGRRRIAAARALEHEAIPARIVTARSSLMPSALTLQANVQRSSNPVAEYAAIERLMKRGVDEHEIATQLGVPVQTIRRRMRLGNLIGDLFDAWSKGHISTTVAEASAKLDPKSQVTLLRWFEDGDKLTLADVKSVRKVRQEQSVASLPAEVFESSAPATISVPVEDLRVLVRLADAHGPNGGEPDEREAVARARVALEQFESVS